MIFTGPHGLRAGWCVFLFFIVFLLSAVAEVWLGHLPFLPHVGPQGITDVDVGLHLQAPEEFEFWDGYHILPYIVATVAMLKIEGRGLSDYFGANVGQSFLHFFPGLLFGIGLIALLVATMTVCGALSLSGSGQSGTAILKWGLRWAAAYLLLAFVEEFTFRGYVFQTITRGLNVFWGASITSLWFVTIHIRNRGETAFGLVSIFLFGLLCCYSVWRSGSLWWAMGFHAAWDWAQTFLFDVGNSGNPPIGAIISTQIKGPTWLSGSTTGPEASILVLPILALGAFIVFKSKSIEVSPRRIER